MAGKYGEHNKVRCSFCNKSEDQVRKLIAGPEGVYICDECIEICAEIIDEELDEYYEQDENQSGINLMKPKEIAEAFAQTEAYSELFMSLATDADKAAAFINQVLPKQMDSVHAQPAATN